MRTGSHDHVVKPGESLRLNKDERLAIGERIVNEYNGSAHEYHIAQMAVKPVEQVPSAAVCQKSKREQTHRDRHSQDWRRDVELTDASQRALPVDDYHYVQLFSTIPSFMMVLQLKEQRHTLKDIQPEHRIGFIDSTGGLVNIPKQQQIAPIFFKPIMNYFLLAKDLSRKNETEWKSFLVGEFLTSDQSIGGASTFLDTINMRYQLDHSKPMYFRYLIDFINIRIIFKKR